MAATGAPERYNNGDVIARLPGGSHQFFVKTITGKSITVTADRLGDTFASISAKINEKFPLRVGEEIPLIYEGKQINGANGVVHIRASTTVYIIMRLRGGMEGAYI